MTARIVAAIAVSALQLAIAAKRPSTPELVSYTDQALATTTTRLKHPHAVRSRSGIDNRTLEVDPLIARALDGSSAKLLLRLRVTSVTHFEIASLATSIDGHLMAVRGGEQFYWKPGFLGGAETVVEDAAVVQAIARAGDAYLTILFPLNSGRISFRLSPEQIADCAFVVQAFQSMGAR